MDFQSHAPYTNSIEYNLINDNLYQQSYTTSNSPTTPFNLLSGVPYPILIVSTYDGNYTVTINRGNYDIALIQIEAGQGPAGVSNLQPVNFTSPTANFMQGQFNYQITLNYISTGNRGEITTTEGEERRGESSRAEHSHLPLFLLVCVSCCFLLGVRVLCDFSVSALYTPNGGSSTALTSGQWTSTSLLLSVGSNNYFTIYSPIDSLYNISLVRLGPVTSYIFINATNDLQTIGGYQLNYLLTPLFNNLQFTYNLTVPYVYSRISLASVFSSGVSTVSIQMVIPSLSAPLYILAGSRFK